MAGYRKACVVLAGNEEDFCPSLSKILKINDIHVLRADSSVELSRIVKISTVDLILFSLDFVTENTSVFLTDLRRSSKYRLKIILVGNFSLTAMKYSLSAGFDDFAALPIGEEEVIALIQSSNDQNDTKSKYLTN